jgi:hypothetical protein
MNQALTDALLARKPEVAASITRLVEAQYAMLLREFGGSDTFERPGYHVANSRFYTVFSEIIRPLCTRTDEGGVGRKVHHYTLDPARVAAYADKRATESVLAWEGKLAAKMGELEGATVAYLHGNVFAVNGTKQGHAVRVEQDMIINVSSKGKLFNQFPARLYVDGKFTSAAAYAKKFA